MNAPTKHLYIHYQHFAYTYNIAVCIADTKIIKDAISDDLKTEFMLSATMC